MGRSPEGSGSTLRACWKARHGGACLQSQHLGNRVRRIQSSRSPLATCQLQASLDYMKLLQTKQMWSSTDTAAGIGPAGLCARGANHQPTVPSELPFLQPEQLPRLVCSILSGLWFAHSWDQSVCHLSGAKCPHTGYFGSMNSF